jgi:dienelactone hydrolase
MSFGKYFTTSVVVGLLLLVAIARLALLDAGGPRHSFVQVGNAPATIYLPGPPPGIFEPNARPAAIVLIHGLSFDRQAMSVLARRIASNGYAVLAIDLPGHGENATAFVDDLSILRDEVRLAVAHLRIDKIVDGRRIAVIGHSMGANAALDYAEHDQALKAVVTISGGISVNATRPSNALFLFAQDDEPSVRQRSVGLAASLAGVPEIELGRTYGDLSHGSAVEAVEVRGVGHSEIIYSDVTARTIVQWLDHTFGVQRSKPIDLAEPRLEASAFALAVFVIFLILLGHLCSSIATKWPEQNEGGAGLLGIVFVGIGLAAAMELIPILWPSSLFSGFDEYGVVPWFAIAGVILGPLALFRRLRDWRTIRAGAGATFFASVLAFSIIYVCQIYIFLPFHRLTLTRERWVIAIVATLLTFPFWVTFEFLVRRRGLAASICSATIGRLLILILLLIGLHLSFFPYMLVLVLPIFLGMSAIFAVAAYRVSRNLLLIGLVEAAWLASLIAAVVPVTIAV